MNAALRLFQPHTQLVNDLMELIIAHQSSLQLRLPARRMLTNPLPALINASQSIAQLTRFGRVQRVRGQMVAHDIQRGNDALVRLQIQEELAMIGHNVLEQLNAGGWLLLGFLRAFGELQPLFQAPQVVVDLLPVALRAERTRQAGGIAGGGGTVRCRVRWMRWDNCVRENKSMETNKVRQKRIAYTHCGQTKL